MKYNRLQSGKSGFTLVELLVAMAITIILLGTLVYLTGISMDSYRDSRNEVRASRQAKEAMSTIAKDFESMVSRRDGNNFQWLYAGPEDSGLDGPSPIGGEDRTILNTSRLIFFTGATDRYNGDIGGDGDLGGDVSAVSYRLVYRDQIQNPADGEEGDRPVFALYRHLIDPKDAFDHLLAQDNLEQAYTSNFTDDLDSGNFLVENVYEFTVTFLIETTDETGITSIVRATMSEDYLTEFTVSGSSIDFEGSLPPGVDSGVESGSIIGVDISITVLSDQGLTLAQKSGISQSDLVKKHGYHYTKTITTPRP